MKVNLAKLAAKRDAAQVNRERIRTNERNARRAALLSNIARPSRGVITSAAGAARAVPKQPREKCAHLLAMAKGKPCLFWFVAGCRRDYDSVEHCTTVKAHENSLDANKGAGTKAHDWRSVDACGPCHVAYDQGKDHTWDEKAAAFAAAYARQLAHWREVANSATARAKDSAACRWALNRYEFHKVKGDQA